MKKYFKNNKSYFDFINKNKDNINIKEVKILSKNIRVFYEVINES